MHQCVRCSRVIPAESEEILRGCKECHGKFFFYIKNNDLEESEKLVEMPEEQIDIMEEDIREMVGITDNQAPVILDIESIRVTGKGKFELDIVKLFNKRRPLIYKLEEGKYIIDLSSTLDTSLKEIKQIRDPEEAK